MIQNKWKTVIVDSGAALEYDQGLMRIKSDDGEKELPICQIKTVIINSLQVRITAYLLNELAKEKTKVIFCNEKKNPYSELIGKFDNGLSPERLKTQIKWTKKEKDIMWQKIVKTKIDVSKKLLFMKKLVPDSRLTEYMKGVTPGDKSNREGQAARLYFNTLFGKGFVRTDESAVNSALNYGYSIILSEMNRIITSYGYNTSLGIKHDNMYNYFNLSCDLIEPFRAFVDDIVVESRERELDKDYKLNLISVTGKTIKYDGKKMELCDAMELFASDVLKNMKNSSFKIKEIDFIA